jgi:hypothetical protein
MKIEKYQLSIIYNLVNELYDKKSSIEKYAYAIATTLKIDGTFISSKTDLYTIAHTFYVNHSPRQFGLDARQYVVLSFVVALNKSLNLDFKIDEIADYLALEEYT